MNANETTIKSQLEELQTEPGQELREKVLQNAAADGTAPPLPARRGPKLRTLLTAAVVVSLAITTAFATTVLPGLIERLKAGNLTVNQYEPGMLPYEELSSDVVGVLTVDEAADFTEYTILQLDSLDEVKDKLGFTPSLPTLLNYGEKLKFIHLWERGETDQTLELYYDRHDRGQSITDGEGVRLFIVYQRYVGEAPLNYDTVEQSRSITVNGCDAIISNNMSVMWVKDGVLFQVMAADTYTADEVIEIAESLEPIHS